MTKILSKIALLFVLLFSFHWVFAEELTPVPTLTSPVMDTAQMLSGSARQELEKHLLQYSQEKGSQIAKNGFRNEYFVIDTFNAWENNSLAQEWLMAMDYQINEIEYVKAEKVTDSYKADVQVHITIKLKKLIDCQNIQVKLVSNKKGFNQIDKRWLAKYQ